MDRAATAMVNQYYMYCLDADFGPFFIKFSSYFPYNGKICLTGTSGQVPAAKSGIDFEPLDNGSQVAMTRFNSSGSAIGSVRRRSMP